MASDWSEILTALEESRRELVLSGPDVSARIERHSIPEKLYTLTHLNFLEISKTCLNTLSPNIQQLCNLTNLAVHSNKLTSLPETVGQLAKLKYLDFSRNSIEYVPESLTKLSELQTLNLSWNKIKEIPDISSLVQLHVLDISNNELQCLPEGIASPDLSLLNTINASHNQIVEIPSQLSDLPSLKKLDVSENKIQVVPPEISECYKLKEFLCRGNKLKDRRLGKMIEQCHTKSVLEYLGNILGKEKATENKGKSGGGKKDKKKKGKKAEEEEQRNEIQVLHFPEKGGVSVHVSTAVLDVRPYIVCCIIRNINLEKSSNMFKRFITLQTKIHETLCQKRQAATIATHSLPTVKGPLLFEARTPSEMKLIPLGRQKDVTADKLVAKLRQEAEELRKEKKRSTVSGIHKYLDLLKNKPLYPCLVDADGDIISFPPITNCEKTKVSKETRDILVEVTSSTDLNVCKVVLDELLQQVLELGVGTSESTEGAAGGEPETSICEKLTVEQVKVTDEEGALKVLYPSRTDLTGEAYRVVRDYE